MDTEITKLLSTEDPEDAFHAALLRHAKRLMAMSKSSRVMNYDGWDLQERVFRGEIIPDSEDKKNVTQGRPVKVIMPTCYAQVMTFVSFHFLQFSQGETFFQLRPTGDEDFGTKKWDSELTLEFQLRKNEWNAKLFQHLLDTGRFGEGILEVSWTKEMMRAWIARETEAPEVNGVEGESRTEAGWEEYIKYEGNKIRNVSPYRFFPDTRHALVDFQKGEFCAIEEEYSMNQLYELEASGEVAGVKYIQPIVTDKTVLGGATIADVMSGLRGPLGKNEKLLTDFTADNGSSIALITKMQIWIIPSKFKIDKSMKVQGATPVTIDGEMYLGKENHRVLYHLWYANGNRVIRIEPAKVWHNEFSFTVSQFTPDMHQDLTFGLGELIYPIQELQSWYANSHVRSVDRVIANRLIVAPNVIDTKTLDGNGDIYLRKGVSMPIERAVGQLRVQDVTGNHMMDANILGDVIEQVTGVNKMMQGQSSTGRRSSFQDRTVAGGAASRMKMHGALIWESSLGRVGRIMLSNSRQSLSFDSFVRVVGAPSEKEKERYVQAMQQYQVQMQMMQQAVMSGQVDPATLPPPPSPPVDPMVELEERYDAFKGTPEEVICGDDYMIYDNTMPQDKGMMAQSLQELLMVAMQNPEMAVRLDLSAQALLEEMLRLRDAGPVSRFSLRKRIEQGIEMPPPPPVQEPAPAPPGPDQSTTDARSTTTTTHAPVIHIHNPKPETAKAK